jgi:D-arabinono-1,4-lactone oxidase
VTRARRGGARIAAVVSRMCHTKCSGTVPGKLGPVATTPDIARRFANWAGNRACSPRATAEQLHARYPRAADFVNLRRELDPSGVFLNDHLRELCA